MNKLSLAFAVGSMGSMFLGITQGCGTNETAGTPKVLSDGGAGAPGNVDSGPTGSSRTPIGRGCLKDSDCGGAGIVCLASTSRAFSGGGPAGGMCAVDCTNDPCRTSTDPNVRCATCDAVDPNSVCVGVSQVGNVAYCLQGCAVGPTQATDQKCHGRLDVACDDRSGSGDGFGFCAPMCRNDGDCGARKCDLVTGLCRDAKEVTGTIPIGDPCKPADAVDTCIGACAPLTQNDAGTGPGMCIGFCNLSSLGCGANPNAAEPPRAVCLFDATTAGAAGPGDVGLCGKLCDCNDECTTYHRTACIALAAAEQSAFGRAGYCGPPVSPTTGKPTASIPCTGKPDAGRPKPSKDAGSD